nr:putative leucine-rich repeat-containing protein DDB_G0290503 [Halyomorpha halys]
MFQEEEQEQNQDLMSIDKIEESHTQLVYQIQEITEEKDALKLITQNQLKNINELQEKCEESFIAINQLPENRNIASDRYYEAMTEITKLQNKQLEINELLNLSLKEFDENMQLTNNARILFDSETNIANQRRLIYQSSINEIKCLGEKNIMNLKESINDKSALLETVNKHLNALNVSKISLENELEQISENKSKISLMNNDLRQQCSEVEEEVRKFSEEVKILENDMLSKQDFLNYEMEHLKIELETSNNDLQQLEEELNDISAKIEFIKNENIQFKNKTNEAEMLSNNLRSSLESKRTEINALQTESEKRKIEITNLKNIIKEIGVLATKCSDKEAQIQELIIKKECLMNVSSALKDKLKIINEKIDNDNLKYKAVVDETEENKHMLITVKTRTDQHEKDLDQLKKSSEARISSLSVEIEQLTINNSKLRECITEKEGTIDNQQKELAALKSEIEEKKTTLTEKLEKTKTKNEDLNKKLEEVKLKKEDLMRELQEKKDALNERKIFNETVKNMREKIALEKEKYESIKQSHEKEKQELRSSCNKQLEETIQKLQTLKNEEIKQWETVRDRAGKAEFSYYRVKSQAQRLKAEVSFLNENLKTYNCENEMLKMLIGWINNDVSASDAESTRSKNKENPGVLNDMAFSSVKSDSSFDEETENEQAEDLVIQKYHMSRVHGQEAARDKASYYCVSERPIVISTDNVGGSQVSNNDSSQTKESEHDISINSQESGPSWYNPPSFYQDQAKQNAERKTIKHKIQDTIVIKVSF